MKNVRLFAAMLCTAAAVNCRLLVWTLHWDGWTAALAYLGAAALFVGVQFLPIGEKTEGGRLGVLNRGGELLLLYLVTALPSVALAVWAGVSLFPARMHLGVLIAHCVILLLAEGILLLSGGLRVFATSVQMGVKWRVVMLCLWWLPLAGYGFAWKLCRTGLREYREETARCVLERQRAEEKLCATKYPVLLVHGVFFRDSKLLNYWGRIPEALTQNGASVYYGNQQSAASVADSARELADRIRQIVAERGCEKVNIIAHSKGGLDARYAISCLGVDEMVASLTTINTPHRGCVFAEQLLNITPAHFQNKLDAAYNSALRRLGDQNPDFLAAVRDLTASACGKLNEAAPDSPSVFYASVGSYVRKARGGQFPLNVSYDLVRHFDGRNDGLVSVESAKWGARFTLLEPLGMRGITHADVIDLNRENIRGFDVREFYVQLVSDLRRRGF